MSDREVEWLHIHHSRCALTETVRKLQDNGNSGELATELVVAGKRTGLDTRALDKDLKWLEGDQCRVIGYVDPDYPALLAEIADPPLLFYVQGHLDVLHRPAIAVVGARKAIPRVGGKFRVPWSVS